MSLHFHPLTIKKVVHETSDCITASLNIPEGLLETFNFKEGQYLTFRKMIDGEEVRRSYSICKAPYENELTVAIKRVSGGIFSNLANDNFKPGYEIDVMPPTGNFSTRINSINPNYLAISAGSGITPIISIIKQTLKTQPESKFTLIYGNKNRGSILFFEELEELKNKYMERFTLIHILSREKMDADIAYGRVDKEKLVSLQSLVPFNQFSSVYLCGPESMILTSTEFLKEQGMEKSNIHFELFGTAAAYKKSKPDDSKETSSGPKSKITIRLDGRSSSFELAYDSKSILDAALTAGADLPFACKGGVCCTCRAKLVEGQVAMDVNYALEPEEVEQGFILTCQAHPLTETVVIDFDQK
jgi:ring-1,2-phenylacetyl-CoA epoxidase subunit PaaE